MISLESASLQAIPQLVALWNDAFANWPLTERLLRQTLENDPFHEPEGHFVARDNGAIIGWALCKSNRKVGPELERFQNRGGIGALCVHPQYQRRGIGTQLLQACETYLQSNGSPLTTLYFPHHLLPGIPADSASGLAFFKKHGYEGFTPCVDLWRELSTYELPAKAVVALAKNPTVEVRRARNEEANRVLDFVSREFPGGWTYSIKTHFARGGQASDIVVSVEDSEVIGFCHTTDWRNDWLLSNVYWHPLLGEHFGGLGPIGIGAEHRKRGLGLALCAVAVEELKRAGVETMAIDWTTLIDFYGQMGFTVWKTYLQGEKSTS